MTQHDTNYAIDNINEYIIPYYSFGTVIDTKTDSPSRNTITISLPSRNTYLNPLKKSISKFIISMPIYMNII